MLRLCTNPPVDPELIDVAEAVQDLPRGGGASKLNPLGIAGQPSLEPSMANGPIAYQEVEVVRVSSHLGYGLSSERGVGCKRRTSGDPASCCLSNASMADLDGLAGKAK